MIDQQEQVKNLEEQNSEKHMNIGKVERAL